MIKVRGAKMRKLLWLLCLMMIVMTGSCGVQEPPTAEDIDSFVIEHWEEINMVNKHLMAIESDFASIDDQNGPVVALSGSYYYDREELMIADDALSEALHTLWRSGVSEVYKDIKDNCIQYLLWNRERGQAWCGFVYAIDTKKPAKVPYQTEMKPLSEEGWYYYLCEYEEWRLKHGR